MFELILSNSINVVQLDSENSRRAIPEWYHLFPDMMFSLGSVGRSLALGGLRLLGSIMFLGLSHVLSWKTGDCR